MSIFLFQAEDGIRDLVRSRGLGDVYKRQALINGSKEDFGIIFPEALALKTPIITLRGGGIHAVSYTHLTLPTSDLV